MKSLDYTDHDQIRDVLMGHKVTKVSNNTLVLDNGTELVVVPNEGGCACSAGDYEIEELKGVDNIITNVEFVQEGDYDYGEFTGSYKIFVYADNQKINLLSVDGSDGNGYYGTGYWINVQEVGA